MSQAFAEIMLFTGDGCPHCEVVEEYLADNQGLAEKIGLKSYEVWYNPGNQDIYVQKAKEVGYTGGGVPFLVDGSYFTVGDSPIISYLEEKRKNLPGLNVELRASVIDSVGSLTKEDSEQLNDIIEEKIDDGEASRLEQSNELYGIGNAVDEPGNVAMSETESKLDFVKKHWPYFIGGLALFVIIIVGAIKTRK